MRTFLGRAPDVAEGGGDEGWLTLAMLRRLLTSESLPIVGRFDDVTELSELRRGRVLEALRLLEVADSGGRAGLRRMDLMGGCCCWS